MSMFELKAWFSNEKKKLSQSLRSKQCKNFLWQVQYRFFLDTIFSSHLLEELWNYKDFVLGEIGFARGTLQSALRTTGTASARFHEHSCIQFPSQDQVQDLNSHLWRCVFLHLLSWWDSGPPQHCVCRHLPTQHSTAELSPVFCAMGQASDCSGRNVNEQIQ